MKFLRILGYGLIGFTLACLGAGLLATIVGIVIALIKFAPWTIFIAMIFVFGLVGEEMRKDGVFNGTYEPKTHRKITYRDP